VHYILEKKTHLFLVEKRVKNFNASYIWLVWQQELEDLEKN
jgi:hypothetical protein